MRKVTVCWIRPWISTKQPWLVPMNWIQGGGSLCRSSTEGSQCLGPMCAHEVLVFFTCWCRDSEEVVDEALCFGCLSCGCREALGELSSKASSHFSPVFPWKTGEDGSLAKPREQRAQPMPFFIITPFLSFFMKYCWTLSILLFSGIWSCSLGCR